MAAIVEETITVRISKLVKTNHDTDEKLVSDDIIAALEQVVQELVGDNLIVEIERK